MFPIHNGERFPIIKSEMRMVEICSNRGLYELNAAIPAPRKSAIENKNRGKTLGVLLRANPESLNVQSRNI